MPKRETIATVPINPTDSQTLRMFLLKLIERLDVVLGYRGNFDIVSAEAVFGPGGITDTIQALRKQVENLPRGRQARPVNLEFMELTEANETYDEDQTQSIINAITELQDTLLEISRNFREAGFIAVVPNSNLEE